MPPSKQVPIHVCVRIRPLSKRERAGHVQTAITAPTDESNHNSPSRRENEGTSVVSVAVGGGRGGKQGFKLFHPAVTWGTRTSQESVFLESRLPELMDKCLEGYRATLFAYGQTGAGKTFTVVGEKGSPGLIERGVGYLWDRIDRLKGERRQGRQFVVRVSAVELYNDQCFDLCSRSATNSAISYDRLKPKHIREHKTQGFYVDNLTGARCGSFKSAMRTINAAIRMRTVGATAMNERSSRSHLLITVYIDGSYTDGGGASTFGRLSIVDLAGSERQDNKARAGTSRVRESGFINKSLYTLGKVIANISKGGNTRVPYRDSALTKLLISSLGGECLTTMVACVSPGGDAVAESTRTLAFAMRVKGILCHPVNYVDEREMEVVKLKREIEGLKKENFKLKEMVVEVAQEANMSLGSKGRQHLGLVNEYEAEGWLEGEGAEDGEVEEEDKGEEEDEGDEEELVAVEYHSQDAYSQDAYSDSEEAYSEEEEEGEEEAAAEEELSYSPNPRQQLSSTVPLPSINASKSPAPKKGLFSTATPAALNNTMDSGFQLITVQMELVEARAGVAGGIAGAEETVRVLEKKREALENEMKLVEQLSSIGMPAAEEVEAVQAVSPDSGKKANPFDWNTEEGDSANWQMMWENSLKILADQEETGTSTSPNRRLFGAEKKKKKKKRNKRCPQRQK